LRMRIQSFQDDVRPTASRIHSPYTTLFRSLQRRNIERHTPPGLNRIENKKSASRMDNRSYLGGGLDDATFIVGKMNRDQRQSYRHVMCIKRRLQRLKVQDAAARNRELLHLIQRKSSAPDHDRMIRLGNVEP